MAQEPVINETIIRADPIRIVEAVISSLIYSYDDNWKTAGILKPAG